MKQLKGIDTCGYSLYQINERDLTFLDAHSYRTGDILIFDATRKAKLGNELGSANNLQAAQEFLTLLSEKDVHQLAIENRALQQTLAEKSTRINELSLLTLQNDIQREELISDLKAVSNTGAVQALEELDELRVRVLELETQLFAEKAERDALESEAVLLSAEKNVLESELIEAKSLLSVPQSLTLSQPPSNPQPLAIPQPLAEAQNPDTFKPALDKNKNLVFTNTSGGVIRIYHEFPPIPKRSKTKMLYSQGRRILFIFAALAVVAYIFYLNSVLETMRASGVDVQSYSDAVLAKIRHLFNF